VDAVRDLVRELHRDVLEARGLETRLVLALRERAGNAADVGAARGPLLGLEAVLGDDVGDSDPPAGLQHPGELCEDRRLVRRQVDDAVGDDDVDRVGREGDVLDDAAEEDRVPHAGLVSVAACQGKHLLGHVEAVGDAGRPDPLRREDDVDAASGAEIEHRLALAEVGDGGRVAAA
jgi:hypothetical protein